MPINTNKLFPGERINPGEKLVSNNTQWELRYQADGNLALFDMSKNSDTPAYNPWAAGTQDNSAGFVTLQGNGDFVIFTSVPNVQATNDRGQAAGTVTVFPNWKGVMVVLQDDGNLVLFGLTPLFQSALSDRLAPTTRPTPAPNPNPAATPRPVPADSGRSLVTTGIQVVSAVETAVDVVTMVASLF